MEIRKSTFDDLDKIMKIYAYAREFMAQTGNPKQWGAVGWPPRRVIENDIKIGKSYVCIDHGRIAAVFFFDHGKDIDPCYAVIEGGRWLSDSPYGVVHRIASAKGTKGAGAFCINWAYEQCGHLRMDTHGDNIIMQNLLRKLGFQYCGIIHVQEDNDPRVAYEKIGSVEQ
ncbi:MAG: GNAT family N-acetyltransferase [Ruminococcus sp.]|nr:GNAT family N-acetyltransferase [Ruminococcus sp.]